MRLLTIAACLLLAACTRDNAKPSVPAKIIPRPVKVYVPIEPELTARCKWRADGAPSEVFEISSGRKKCLIQYEIQLDGIGKVQGKPVPEKTP